MVFTTKTYHNGVTYKKIIGEKNCDAALGTGKEKYTLQGKPAIEMMDGSYKFGDQVQLTVFNSAGKTEKTKRVGYAGKYDRMEIFLDREIFREMCKRFLEEA